MSDLNTFAGSLISSAAVKSHHGDEITISDGANTTDTILAEYHDEQQVIDEVSGQLIEWNGGTFKLDAADLVLDSIVTEPAAGMRITKGSTVYEVQPPPGNQRCFAPLLGGLRWLIWAVRVS